MTSPDLLRRYLDEDAPFGDITSEWVLGDILCSAVILAKCEGILAGCDEALMLFRSSRVDARSFVRDGDPISAGQEVMDLQGEARAICVTERTALNILSRMSGIATETHRLTSIVRQAGFPARIAATRKTCPGMRLLDKKAVQIGGGDPHRYSLSDAVMIKDNHLALVPLAEAIRRARRRSSTHTIEVEVGTSADALLAAREGADIVMLDNMTPEIARASIKAIAAAGLRDSVLIEISGGVTPDNLPDYAAAGPDLISIGALTHSVRGIDFSLEVRGPL